MLRVVLDRPSGYVEHVETSDVLASVGIVLKGRGEQSVPRSIHCDRRGMGKSTSARRLARFQPLRNGAGGSGVKPRIIHTYSPKVYKIKPEEFLELVQKLTGRSDSEPIEVEVDSTTSAEPGLFLKLANPQDNVDIPSSYSRLPSEVHEADSSAFAGAPVGTQLPTQLLASLPSPRFVTMNFLPMLAASPSAFSFPSAAY